MEICNARSKSRSSRKLAVSLEFNTSSGFAKVPSSQAGPVWVLRPPVLYFVVG